jgi:hypothetical protein
LGRLWRPTGVRVQVVPYDTIKEADVRPHRRVAAAVLTGLLGLGAIACEAPEEGDPLEDDPGAEEPADS